MITGTPEKFWSRIAKSVARLGCETDAEKLAALGGVERLLAAQGFSYIDMADRLEGHAEPTSRSSFGSSPGFGDMARAARDRDGGRLTPRERAFVLDMCRQGFAFRPSPPQANWLEAIFYKLSPREAA